MQLKGEYEPHERVVQQPGIGLAMAAVLVYLLQVALFRSWVGPFIIMFTVPLGLIGVLTMLFVTRTTLNVQSEMGVIFLVGIAVNNGVLLVEFANKQRKLGAVGPRGDHDGGGHPLPADPDDLPGDVPRPDADGHRHGQGQRGERAAGPGGGGRPADLDLPDAVRGADHVHAADEGRRRGNGSRHRGGTGRPPRKGSPPRRPPALRRKLRWRWSTLPRASCCLG